MAKRIVPTSLIPRRLEDPIEIMIINEELGSLVHGSGAEDGDSLLEDTLQGIIHPESHVVKNGGDLLEVRGFTTPIQLYEGLRDGNGIPLTGRSPGQAAKILEDQRDDPAFCESTIAEGANYAPGSKRETGWGAGRNQFR